MGIEHLTDDGLLRAAYGVAAEAEQSHLAVCRECSAAAARMAAAREAGQQGRDGALGGVPEAFWLRQRRAVLQAAGGPHPVGAPRLAFALAMLLLVALGVSLLVPRGSLRAPAQKPVQAEDEQLFRQVYETANRIEPEALEPLALLLRPEAEGTLTATPRLPRVDVSVSAGNAGVVFSVTVVARQRTMDTQQR